MSDRIRKCQTVVTSSYTTTIAHAILWCNVYDANFIRNSSWLRIVYDKATIAHAILWYNGYDAYFIRNSSWLQIMYDKATIADA